MGLLAMLGYAYTVGVLLATFAGLVVTAMAIGSPGLALWLGAPLFAGGFVVVRVLLVVSREQAGVAIRPAQWPALVTLVDTLRRDLRGPRIHKVVLTTEMNASVVQIPRLVLFGPHRNVLHLGLPLMALVSPDQLRAVVAHEIAHLSRSHGRFALWIHRARLTWMSLAAVFPSGPLTWPIRTFLRWYVPAFSAGTQALSRAFEREADRMAADVAGPHALAGALATLEVAHAWMEEEWRHPLARMAVSVADPPSGVMTDLIESVPAILSSPTAIGWLDRALEAPTPMGDTHPKLSERIAALLPDLDAAAVAHRALRPASSESAADRWLAGRTEGLARDLDCVWQDELTEVWASMHDEASRRAEALTDLASRPITDLSPAEGLARVRLAAELWGAAATVADARDTLAAHPSDPQIAAVAGRLMLELDDAAGLPLIERAATADPSTCFEGYSAAAAFLRRAGRTADARGFERRLDALVDMPEVAPGTDLEDLVPRCELRSPAIGTDDRETLRRALAATGFVERAYLVAVDLPLDPPRAVHLLGVVPRPGRGARVAPDELRTLAVRLTAAPAGTVLVMLAGGYGAWGRRMAAVEGAPLLVSTP